MAPSRRAVLIGGGITGTLTGLALRRAGWSVEVLEAKNIGAGSSSRTAAGIRQQFSTRETVLGMRYAVDFYRRWAETVGGPLSPIQQNGYLFLYDDPGLWAEARLRVERQRGWGLVEVEALELAELTRRFPWLAGAPLLGATWCPTDGFLRPEAVYNDAAEALIAAGGHIRQNAPVLGARQAAGRLAAVQIPGAELGADLFLDCTNAWTRRVGALLGATPLPVAALKRYLWFLDRGEALSPQTLLSMPLVISPSGAYCRPENGDSLLIGWKHDAPDEAEAFTYEDQDNIEPAFYHRSGVESRAYEAWLALAEGVPALGDFAGITATTAGYYGTTPDHNPFLDYDPALPNLIRLVGFSGHGAMFGPFTARVAVALAEAGRSVDSVEVLGERAELAPFRIGRPWRHEAMVI